jgi:hypothetical protein
MNMRQMKHLPGAKAITSSAGSTSATPTLTTGSSFAATITGLSTVENGRSDSAPTGCPSSYRPPGWTPNANHAATTDIEPDHELPDRNLRGFDRRCRSGIVQRTGDELTWWRWLGRVRRR